MENNDFFNILSQIGYDRDREIFENKYLPNILALRISEGLSEKEEFSFVNKLKELSDITRKYDAHKTLDMLDKNTDIKNSFDSRADNYKEIFYNIFFASSLTASLNKMKNSEKSFEESFKILKTIPSIVDQEIIKFKNLFNDKNIDKIIKAKEEIKRTANKIIESGDFTPDVLESIDDHLYAHRESKDKLLSIANGSGFSVYYNNHFDSFARLAKAYSLYKNTKYYLKYSIDKVEGLEVKTKKIEKNKKRRLH